LIHVRVARAWLVFAVVAAGCAHEPRGRWDPLRHELCAGRLCYQLGALAPTWRVVRQQGTQIGFFSDAIGGVIQSNATCRDDAEAVPLSSLTKHLLIGYTDRRLRQEALVPLDGREALHSVLDARLDGVPIVLDLYVLKRNGCIFDLSLASPPGAYALAQADFSRFVAGFAQRSPS
jgi:hypothetical protein